MNISKIAKRQTLNANRIGSINATIKDAHSANTSANIYTNTTISKATDINSEDANVINNVLSSKLTDIRNLGVQKNNSLTHIQQHPLYQKYHGMPGVGVIGLTGYQGEHGNSIYFGHINDFFDGVYVNVGNFIYAISERNDLGLAADKHYYDQIKYRFTNAIYKDIIENAQEDSTYFYTGSYAYGAYDIKYDAADQEKLMYNMLASLSDNTSLISTEDLYVKSTPDYNNPDDTSKYNINKDQTIDDNQIIKLDDSSITYEDRDAIAKILMNSGKVTTIQDAYQPTQIIGNSKYSDFYISDGTYDYIKEVQDSSYIIGATQYYAEVSQTSNTISKVDGKYVSMQDVFFYIKQVFNIIYNSDRDSKLFDGVITTNNNNGYFGLDYSQLFKIVDSKLVLKSELEILNTSDQTLKEFIKKYYSVLINYIQNLQDSSTLTSLSSAIITYSDNGEATLFVPVQLSSYYKTGDTLYFYTNDQSEDDVNIEYMVCLTEDMLECSKDTLINYAQLTTPFSIKRLNNIGSRIECINNAAIFKNYIDSSSDQQFNKSCVNILDNYTNSTLILANADNLNKDFISMNASIYVDNASTNINIDQNNIMHINSKSPLKVSNLYVNIDELTKDFNGELKSYIYDSNIIFNDGTFIQPLDNIVSYIDSADKKVYAAGSVYCQQYFVNYDINNDKAVPTGYVYGYDLYDSNFKLIKSLYSSTNRLDINFALDTDKSVINYYIQIYVAKENGMKFTSRISKITANFNQITVKNKTHNGVIYRRYANNPSTFTISSLKDISIVILGNNETFIPNNIGDKIIYSVSNITATGSNNISLNLYSADSSVQIIDVLFNHENPGQISNWAYIDEIDSSNYTINLSSNLPGGATSLWEYAQTYNASTAEYQYESELFARLNAGIKKDSCNQRSIKVTVAYKDAEDSYIKYQNFDITQPGFEDTRDCPNINLDMHYGITDTQQYNTTEHGVLCNQFITYMDINIDDFKDKWSQYIVDDCSISMDITLQNIHSDIDWQAKNLISLNVIPRPTIKFAMKSEDISNSDLENYVKLNVIPFKTSEDLTSLSNNIIQNIDNTSISATTYIRAGIQATSDVSIINVDSSNYKDEYILINKNVIKNAAQTTYLYNGVQKDFTIDIKNIKFDDYSDNTLKLKIIYEIGNPIISNLYLRFAVSQVKITLTNSENRSIVFFTNVASNNIMSTYLRNYKSAYDYTYRFLSDKLDVMFNPLSYTVCPEDSETTYSAITGSIQKYGMPNEILKSLRFYNSSVYEYDDLISINAKQSREDYKYNWGSLLLKKRYLQDNIKNIAVQPISFDDILGSNKTLPNIDPYNLFLYNKDTYNDTISGYYLDTLAGDKYLSVIYNGAIMNPKYRDDSYSFIYNEEQLKLDRYSQLANNYPAWVSDSCSIEMRSDALIKSMDAWNDEYNYVSSSMSNTNILFKGVLSLYGNGYSYLPNTYDTGQYSDTGYYSDEQIELNSINEQLEKINSLSTISASLRAIQKSLKYRVEILNAKIAAIKSNGTDIGTTNSEKYKDVMSLKETKSLNDVYIYNSITYDRIYGAASTIYEPEVYKYYRAFLYNINWIYPKYTNNSEVTPYRLVSGFDYLLNISETAQSLYKDKFDKLKGSIDNITEMVPYNLLYSVYPRVAYNDEKDTLNCLMLRRPSIGTDTDINSFNKCYILNKRYFNLSGEIKQLDVPYTVK